MPVAALLFNALVWGLSWWPLRELAAAGLHGLWTTSLAFLLAALAVSLWRPGTWRQLIEHRALGWMMLAAGTTNATFNWGLMSGEVLRVVLLFYLMPVWSLLLARWLLGEPITAAAVLRIGLALAGAAIVLWRPGLGLPRPTGLADWLGIAGGASFAWLSVQVRQHREMPASARALAGFLGGAVVAGALALLLSSSGRIAGPPPAAVGWTVGLVAFASVLLLGNLALQYGAARLPAATSAIVMLSEVPFAALSSSWFGAETLGWQTLAGGVLIMLATALAVLGPRPRPTAAAG